MNSLTQMVHSLLNLLIEVGDIIVSALVTVELWLRSELSQFGVPPVIQTVLLVAVAAVLVIGSLRLFGGLIRVGVVLVLILIALHIVLPVLPH